MEQLQYIDACGQRRKGLEHCRAQIKEQLSRRDGYPPQVVRLVVGVLCRSVICKLKHHKHAQLRAVLRAHCLAHGTSLHIQPRGDMNVPCSRNVDGTCACDARKGEMRRAQTRAGHVTNNEAHNLPCNLPISNRGRPGCIIPDNFKRSGFELSSRSSFQRASARLLEPKWGLLLRSGLFYLPPDPKASATTTNLP